MADLPSQTELNNTPGFPEAYAIEPADNLLQHCGGGIDPETFHAALNTEPDKLPTAMTDFLARHISRGLGTDGSAFSPVQIHGFLNGVAGLLYAVRHSAEPTDDSLRRQTAGYVLGGLVQVLSAAGIKVSPVEEQ
jgi:hypothetical protein